MIGFYDYTVILTYGSLLSAVGGMALAINGHPIWATLCLLFCGLCDMFDGKVARTKKNRTDEEKSFGIQIDSLADVVAFGVLPAVIALRLCHSAWYACVISGFYVLAGLIRLAYFNVTEEMRQKETTESRKSYSGLPITSAALIFPAFFCLAALYTDRLLLNLSLCGVMLITGLLFILPIRVRKPQTKEMWFMFALGALIATVLIGVAIAKVFRDLPSIL